MIEYIIPVVTVLIVLGLCYYFLKSDATAITNNVQDGKKEVDSSKKIQRSTNQPDGIEFSYTCWIRIDDFTYRYGEEKIIFVKGAPDLTIACPALVIDANTNSLLVKMDTFGTQEIVPVVSVPSKKWLFITITVNQHVMDVYVNGISYTHHELSQLPKQNSGSLIIAPKGGFAGKVVSLKYYPNVLSESDILGMASQKPPISSETGTQVLPPYFSSRWFKNAK